MLCMRVKVPIVKQSAAINFCFMLMACALFAVGVYLFYNVFVSFSFSKKTSVLLVQLFIVELLFGILLHFIITKKIVVKSGYILFDCNRISVKNGNDVEDICWDNFTEEMLIYNGESANFGILRIGKTSFLKLSENNCIPVHIPTRAFYVSIVSYLEKLKSPYLYHINSARSIAPSSLNVA